MLVRNKMGKKLMITAIWKKNFFCILSILFNYDDSLSSDLHLETDSKGELRTKLYDKRDDFDFPIVNFPFMSSNIPAAPAYGM